MNIKVKLNLINEGYKLGILTIGALSDRLGISGIE